MMKIDQISSERINILRFPLIVGVVFIHANTTQINLSHSAVGISNTSFITNFVRYLVSFGIAGIAVPLFFLLSGYLFFLGFSWSITNYKDKLLSRSRSLLFPFLFWNISTLIMLALAQKIPGTQMFFSGNNVPISSFNTIDYINAVIGFDKYPISYQFWFVRDLIFLVLLTPVIHSLIRWSSKVFLVGIYCIWFFDMWPIYMPSGGALAFFYAGAYLSSSRISLFVLDRFGKILSLCYICILLIETITRESDLNIYIHRVGVFFGIAAALFLSKTIVYHNNTKKVLLWLSSCSFFVFAVHEPLLTVVRKIVFKILAPSSDVTILLLYFSIPIVIISVSVLLYAAMKILTPRFLGIISGGR